MTDSAGPAGGHRRLSTPGWIARAVAAVAALAVLAWAWQKSEIDPPKLIGNRHQAADYLFGEPLSEEAAARLRAQAERTTLLSLRQELEARAREQNDLEPADPLPPSTAQTIEHALAEAVDTDAFEKRVARTYERLEQQTRGGYFPPETDPQQLRLYTDALLETLAIAIWGTALAIVSAIPASFLAAHRSLEILLPGVGRCSAAARASAVFLSRRLFDICRGFNEFVLALVIVAVIGLGPFAGVLAVAVHSFGLLGKIFADAIDTAERDQVEGVLATGAAPLQIISFSILPQVLPHAVSQSLLRFESNVRSATVLGIVGAGGIGFLIDAKLKAYQFREVATMMILIIALVSAIDLACRAVLRRVT